MAQSTLRPAPRVKSKSKPERHCRLSPDRGIPGARRVLSLYIGAEAFLYWIKPIPADWGTAYEIEKFTDGEVYHVHLDSSGDSCTCLGHLRWGNRTVCKHVAAVKALRAKGQLS